MSCFLHSASGVNVISGFQHPFTGLNNIMSDYQHTFSVLFSTLRHFQQLPSGVHVSILSEWVVVGLRQRPITELLLSDQ